jgi:hypothetical protein
VREPTSSLFDSTTVTERVTPSGKNGFDDNFQVYFCDDVDELNEAYFRDFSVRHERRFSVHCKELFS